MSAALRRTLELYKKLVAQLPRCRPWLSGSGGHKRYGRCPRLATWTDRFVDGILIHEDYCDEHKPAQTGVELEEFDYADEARALEAFIGEV